MLRRTTSSSCDQQNNESANSLARGRTCYDRNEWNDAFEALSLADQEFSLEVEDLQRLAWAAGLTARDEHMLTTQERVYRAHLDAGSNLAAARASFWLGFRLLARGDHGQASGWLQRTQRLIELHSNDCVEQGYLLLPTSQKHLSAGEYVEAHDCAARGVVIGERFSDADLVAFARNLQGRALLNQGLIERGLVFMDEAMVAATAGELSPVVTGIIYCSAIASCNRVYALDRVREWTMAISAWCDANPQLGMFTAHCLVHRAHALEMSGAWSEAVKEAGRAVTRCVRDIERDAAGSAYYQQAEIHRLRGKFDLAETAYLEASRAGFEPQPGLALLRLAQSDSDAASSVSRRVVSATRDRLARIRLLPAHVEIMLAVDDLGAAHAASLELQETASIFNTEVLGAIAAHACGSVHLAEGSPEAVVDPVRRAFAVWQQLGAPYLAARLRVLIARACIALNDIEGALLELGCAREVFERVDAQPDVEAVDAICVGIHSGQQKNTTVGNCGLTARELQVLRLIATGKTNKVIARDLSLSEKTVDRHVSNIFVKTDVSSRAAATAFAYDHQLI